MKEDNLKKLRQKAVGLPEEPGVYIMRGSSGKIIYIGKAKSLKNRVSQYFGPQNRHDPKVRSMVENVSDFDYIITDSEFEALILECSMIKQYQPKYNILLKDDKGYHYIKMTNEPYPRIKSVKQKLNDGARYIGPYLSSSSVHTAVDEAVKIFSLPVCSRSFPKDIGKGRPCLNHFIGQCIGVCTGKISEEEYIETVDNALVFLQGGSNEILRTLNKKMDNASQNLEFEKAARIRDCIKAVQNLSEKQKVILSTVKDMDVFALASSENSSCMEVFRFSDGKLYDQEYFILDKVEDAKAARSSLLKQYYSMREKIPPQIALDGETEDKGLLREWLSGKAGRKVTISIPQKGDRRRVVEMCHNNAAERLAQRTGKTGKEMLALDELGGLLGLSSPPEYIESYDISHTGGRETVAGMVVYQNGKPLRQAYKRFKIQNAANDDCGAMREVLERRFSRFEQEKESKKGFGRLPDLILLDGGKPQVSAACRVLEAHSLNVPVFGMVKDGKHKTRAITGSGGEIQINSKRNAFTLVSGIQEEVHRFAITYHRQKRKSAALYSPLTQIEGIGKARAKELLKAFKKIDAVKKAGADELAEVKGMNKKAAQAVYDYYHSEG